MITTRKLLQQLIDEEFSRAILERRGRRLAERMRGSQEIYELDSYELIDFAKAYRKLGDAVQDQLDSILNDSQANVNPNAIDLIKDELGGLNREIDDAIAAYEEELGERDDDDEDDGTWAAAARINDM
jgi:hypothetical protein